jgi:23S rRNA (guanosine2251-2'-O)-methyltransferase
MLASSFEIRVCQSCGLRYPLTEGHSFGVRCPHCLGETRIVLNKQIGGDGALKEESDALPKKYRDNVRFSKGSKRKEVKAVLLDNIRSAWNVGSILRSADGFGFSHTYLCGITPTPEVDAVRKTALGADEYVTWSHHKDAVKLVKGLKKEGWKIFALEEHERAQPVSQIGNLTNDTVLIVGSEVTGVDPELLDLADRIFYIPMHGQKRSFNVAVAFGAVGYSLSS